MGRERERLSLYGPVCGSGRHGSTGPTPFSSGLWYGYPRDVGDRWNMDDPYDPLMGRVHRTLVGPSEVTFLPQGSKWVPTETLGVQSGDLATPLNPGDPRDGRG